MTLFMNGMGGVLDYSLILFIKFDLPAGRLKYYAQF